MTKKSYEIDMCNGPLWGKILLFSIPLMLSGILQLLFNAADIVVVGRYVGNEALAAVGSTSCLINLLTNVFWIIFYRFWLVWVRNILKMWRRSKH